MSTSERQVIFGGTSIDIILKINAFDTNLLSKQSYRMLNNNGLFNKRQLDLPVIYYYF